MNGLFTIEAAHQLCNDIDGAKWFRKAGSIYYGPEFAAHTDIAIRLVRLSGGAPYQDGGNIDGYTDKLEVYGNAETIGIKEVDPNERQTSLERFREIVSGSGIEVTSR